MKIDLQVGLDLPVNKSGVTFPIFKDGKRFGTLTIRRSGLQWKPAHKEIGYLVPWSGEHGLAELFEAFGSTHGKGASRPKPPGYRKPKGQQVLHLKGESRK